MSWQIYKCASTLNSNLKARSTAESERRIFSIFWQHEKANNIRPINYSFRLINSRDKFLVLISVSNPPTAIPGTLTTETGLDIFGSKGDDDESSSSNSIQIVDKSKFNRRQAILCRLLEILVKLFMVLDSKYLSNLNDINKSEQKSNADISKGLGWPTEGEAGIGKSFSFAYKVTSE